MTAVLAGVVMSLNLAKDRSWRGDHADKEQRRKTFKHYAYLSE